MMERLVVKDRLKARDKDSAFLRFLYHNVLGRTVLKLLTRRSLSKLCGRFMDSSLSHCLIKPFVKNNGILLEDFVKQDYQCFNDCFCREIRPELRPIDVSVSALIAPSDGLLSVYKIDDNTIIPAKHSRYRIDDLLGKDEVAKRFVGGYCLVFRLCVNHYHRYCFVDSGKILKTRFISGQLHTVRPIALEQYPVFVQNCREYTLMQTDNLGLVAQIEIGAMLVGKIRNHKIDTKFERGMEKGMFLYGGSTVVLLIEPNRIKVPQSILDLAADEIEIEVIQGEKIADII